jgi:transcription antitermination factor NusG
VGDRVRVIAGPLAGLTGILIRNRNLAKVVITVELIQQSMAVQLALSDLEPSE